MADDNTHDGVTESYPFLFTLSARYISTKIFTKLPVGRWEEESTSRESSLIENLRSFPVSETIGKLFNILENLWEDLDKSGVLRGK